MAEAHGIRNTVIGTVLGGLLLTFVLWILDLLKPGIRVIWNIIQSLGGFLTSTIQVPIWLVLVLTLVLVIALVAIAKLQAGRRIILGDANGSTSQGDDHPAISLDGLQVSDKHMLGVLYAADGDPVDVPTLARLTKSSKLEVESAMERLEKHGFVDVQYNYVYGTSWTLTSAGRDTLLSLKRREGQ